MSDKHTFSIFYKDLARYISCTSNELLDFIDKDLAHRISRILRLEPGELVTLFDNTINLDLELSTEMALNKYRVCGKILRLSQNPNLLPEITLMPCLLKKEAFEDVAYYAAQMAATRIVPLMSSKVQRKWGNQKEVDRLTNIMISACEQSKNFVLPTLCTPIHISEISSHLHNAVNAYFDPAGYSFFSLLEKIKFIQTKVNLIFGPEGGLTPEEETTLKNMGFESYALTPTILRAKEAVVLGLGGIRSVTK